MHKLQVVYVFYCVNYVDMGLFASFDWGGWLDCMSISFIDFSSKKKRSMEERCIQHSTVLTFWLADWSQHWMGGRLKIAFCTFGFLIESEITSFEWLWWSVVLVICSHIVSNYPNFKKVTVRYSCFQATSLKGIQNWFLTTSLFYSFVYIENIWIIPILRNSNIK